MVVLSTPLLGRGGVVARTSRGPQPCRRNASSSRSFDREQNHVIAEASKHELETPKPNHRGIGEMRVAIWKGMGNQRKTRRTPTWRAKCRCFPPGGSHQLVKLVCVLPFPDGDTKRHKDLSWFGQEKALRPAGEESLFILHLSACTGVNTSGV